MIPIPDIFMYKGKKPYKVSFPSSKEPDGVKCMPKTYTTWEKLKYISTIYHEPHKDGWNWIGNLHGFTWNPFEDDGDAIRLATHLRLEIANYQHEVVVSKCGTDISHKLPKLDDADEALRIAIVEVAFEMYKRTL